MSFSSLWLIPRNNRRLLVTSCNKLRLKGAPLSCSDWSIAKIMPSDWPNCHWVSRDCMTWQWMDFKSSVWGLTATQCIPIVQRADNIDKRQETGNRSQWRWVWSVFPVIWETQVLLPPLSLSIICCHRCVYLILVKSELHHHQRREECTNILCNCVPGPVTTFNIIRCRN